MRATILAGGSGTRLRPPTISCIDAEQLAVPGTGRSPSTSHGRYVRELAGAA
ncbi:hypothetical protein AB0M92_15310 [Streptomyces sp. NPDC051582]|uniref:hypothetical protein n=1 Tax=Streptomyces sp. NPDC051582 TaxID=3155167 RepID=UPI0034374CDB